ncbi:MAG TPA: hypothetical protein VMV25_07925 [Steroidobacteraceae bacterium]|nr:hypothetical protein [Steroidobacteraceae bacterium]
MTAEKLLPDLMGAAVELIKRTDRGDNLAAAQVLEQAAVGLRDVIAGRLPDEERREYLRFLLRALEEIACGVASNKALGLWSDNAPKRVGDDRDFLLFLMVGQQLDTPDPDGGQVTVKAAMYAVANNKRIGFDVVKDAWEKMGARAAWKAISDDEGK